MSRTAYIYALGDPRDGRIYYVGCSLNPKARWREHARGDSDTCGADPLNAAIKASGLEPVMVILAAVPEEERDFREREWMRDLSAAGHKLHNKKVSFPIRTDIPLAEALHYDGIAMQNWGAR